VHNTAVNRADRAGGAVNCRMLAASAKHGGLIEGSPEAEVLLELGRDPRDIEIARYHGMTPFTSTSLDQVLRNLGITTVVATGNSVNIGVLGLVMVAVDLGYQVVVVRDAVAGVPKAYADAVLDNTIALLATIVTTDELLAAWS
jgi:nicotinamidase-related amidase